LNHAIAFDGKRRAKKNSGGNPDGSATGGGSVSDENIIPVSALNYVHYTLVNFRASQKFCKLKVIA
jgi:hypothetical protein